MLICRVSSVQSDVQCKDVMMFACEKSPTAGFVSKAGWAAAKVVERHEAVGDKIESKDAEDVPQTRSYLI